MVGIPLTGDQNKTTKLNMKLVISDDRNIQSKVNLCCCYLDTDPVLCHYEKQKG